MLVQPAEWMNGSWSTVPEGWTNERQDRKLLSLDEARVLIADRINELNLNSDLVYGYPRSHSTIAEYQAFLQMSFADQMRQFTSAKE